MNGEMFEYFELHGNAEELIEAQLNQFADRFPIVKSGARANR